MSPKRKKKADAGNKAARPLLYKVVELSTVDESALERTVNEWVPHGWKFDGVQFAMRESSKRPSMAFVFFTREGVARPIHADDEVTVSERARSADAAEVKLRRLADDGARQPPPVSAWERLAQLAGEDEP